MKKQILLIGGDQRTPYLAKMLAKHNFNIFMYGMEQCPLTPFTVTLTKHLDHADLYILPIPFSKDGKTIHAPFSPTPIPIKDVIDLLRPGDILVGGNIPDWVMNHGKNQNIIVFDYGKSNEFADENALPTAEGTLEILLNQTPCVLEGKSVCVVGYGRIGKILAKKLKALDCNVTVTARQSHQLETIRDLGYTPLLTNNLCNGNTFDIIINTVPAPVVNKDVINHQEKNCLIIDLASKPGGVDFEYANELGIKTIHALSLPAKHAPETAAMIIEKSILKFLEETE